MENTANMIAPEKSNAALQTANVAAQDVNQTQVAKATPAPQKPIKAFGIEMPDFISDNVHALQAWGTRWRRGAIEKTPAVIVNNSSNFIGSMQLVAEVLMTKSSGINLVNPENRTKPLHYIIDPVKNIYGGAIKRSKMSIGGNPLKASFYTEMPENIKTSVSMLRDLEAATLRDRVHTAPMFNKWQARSGLAGIIAMSVATFLPDHKDTPEETERMTKMSKEHPFRYVGMRVYQALNPLEWWKHKRQFAGLGMLTAGGLSVVSGYRQVEGKFTADMIAQGLKNEQKYMHNGWQVAGGFITMIGGTQLMMAIDNEQGWRNFGVTQMTRLLTLPNSIMTRFKKTEQGAAWYLAGNSVFQVKNVLAASIGGAEKREDGSIVDHSEIRKEATEKVKLDRLAKGQRLDEQPFTSAANVHSAEALAQADQVDLSTVLPKGVVTHTEHAAVTNQTAVKEHKETDAAVTEHKPVHHKAEHHASEQHAAEHAKPAHPKPVHHDQADAHAAVSHEKPTHLAKAETHHEHTAQETHQKPVTHISGHREVEHAMPERVAHHQQMAATAAN